jgi:hypothetical protein
MPTIRHAHSSSLYSKGPLSLAEQVERAIEAEDPNATLLTFTEVGSNERAQVLKDADPENWAAWVPGVTDVGLMWRKAQFDPIWKEPHKLTGKTWVDGKGRTHETHCGSVLLRHDETGGRVLVSVCHLPSNVQNGCALNQNKQAAAWASAVEGWCDYWNQIRKRDHPDVALIVADWNVDFHKGCWMGYVGDVFPSMFCTWAGDREPPADKGTHGNRLIDATWATHKPSKAKLLQDDASSDHRPYGEAIPW